VCRGGARAARPWTSWRGRRCALAAAALLIAGAAQAQRWAIEDVGQGPVVLAPGDVGAHELSGLTWAGGERFYAVSDDGGRLVRLRIAVDAGSGAIRSASVDGALALAQARDLEGVAMGADDGSVFVTDEIGPAVREYRRADGRLLRGATIPAPFDAMRYNLGFESLARDAHGALWTANEDALAVDGPTSSSAAGSLVRLQRFDRQLRPDGQWPYALDAVGSAMPIAGRGTGLSELVALPDGRLLALERSLGNSGLRIRLYAVDVSEATDVRGLPSLVGARIVPARKHLLWERSALGENLEGAALGATLADGSRSLLLVSDDGHGLAQVLYALRLRAVK